jgi:uncharacterized protein
VNVNLRELALKGTPVELRGRLDFNETILNRNDIKLTGPIEAELTAHTDISTFIVSGKLTAELELICSKCLRTAGERVEYPVTEMFTLVASVAEQDEDIHLVQEEIVDLTPYLREAFVVQLPMVLVCGTDCKGLCPECGKDRNAEACDCVHEKLDPRLAGLKDFFLKS